MKTTIAKFTTQGQNNQPAELCKKHKLKNHHANAGVLKIKGKSLLKSLMEKKEGERESCENSYANFLQNNYRWKSTQ